MNKTRDQLLAASATLDFMAEQYADYLRAILRALVDPANAEQHLRHGIDALSFTNRLARVANPPVTFFDLLTATLKLLKPEAEPDNPNDALMQSAWVAAISLIAKPVRPVSEGQQKGDKSASDFYRAIATLAKCQQSPVTDDHSSK